MVSWKSSHDNPFSFSSKDFLKLSLRSFQLVTASLTAGHLSVSPFSYSNLSLTSSRHCILLTPSSVLQTPSNLSGQVDSQAVSKLLLLRSSKSGLPSSSVSSHSTRDFCLQSWKPSIAV